MPSKFEIYDPIHCEFNKISLDVSREILKSSLSKDTHSFGALNIRIEESKFGLHKAYPVLDSFKSEAHISKKDLETCENFLSSKKLVLIGSDFHRRILRSLIKLNTQSANNNRTTISYTDFTIFSGLQKNYVRAVARSIAANEHFLTIPCHRILASDGSLRGYRWGTPLKKFLLENHL